MFAARLHRARLALVIHGVESWQRRTWLARLAVKSVESFISVSRFSAEKFTSWSKLPMDRAFILPNGVDLDHFVPQPRSQNLVDRYDLRESKVIHEVIDLMPKLLKRLSSVKYLIVGDGPDRQRLEQKVTALGLSGKVIFTGRISESEKVAHYNLADAYVMPSAGEGFGIVLIEAAACGLPIVGSRADGSREALLDGRLGHVVDPQDQLELLGAVTDALEKGSRRQRSELVSTFSSDNFRRRVANWLCQEYESCCKLVTKPV
jgi:glycosyltransferase involved in cell wall biosynthesis